MSGAWNLLRRDLARATQNTMAVVVVVGLVILPSLFTWFNVIASWDPLNNTKGLTVAVANSDDGYQSSLIPLKMNIGDQVISALRANNDLNWVVTDEDTAVEGTKSGEFYAAIVLPPDFSQEMLTFYADGGTRTDIIYYINEKKNPLAPKITGQGADQVSREINTVFTKTLGEIAVGIVSDLSKYLGSADTQVMFAHLSAQVGQTSALLRSAATNADAFGAVLGSSANLVSSAGALVSNTSDALSDSSQGLGNARSHANALKNGIDSVAGQLDAALSASAESYKKLAAEVSKAFDGAHGQVEAQAQALDALAHRVDAQIADYESLKAELHANVEPALPPGTLDPIYIAIDNAIARQQAVSAGLTSAATALRNGNASSQSIKDSLTAAISEAEQSVIGLKNAYNDHLKASLSELATSLQTALNSLGAVGTDLSRALGGLSGSAASVEGALQGGQAKIAELSVKLNEAADTFDSVNEALAKASASGDLSGLEEIIGGDPTILATALASPIGLNRTAVFPVANFGSAMAPLYAVLALWVGALLMSVTIKVAVSDQDEPEDEELTSNQKFFGRYGIFAIVGLAQSTILGLGNLIFVGVQAVHPWLFMLAGWISSLVFTFLIYTAVVAFGNAGKALGVFLLVIQISAAGAAYPLQVLPMWFQQINKFIPATYAVEAYRSAIAGMYQADYWKALGILLIFVIPALLLGLYIRKPLAGFNRRIAEAVESTKVMG